jgi:hypothetical protein
MKYAHNTILTSRELGLASYIYGAGLVLSILYSWTY